MQTQNAMAQRFAGKTVLITGAAQGIGALAAESFAAEGATVILADRSPLVREDGERIRQAGRSSHEVEVDLEDFSGADAAASFAESTAGKIDVLVNNVGGTIWTKPFHEYGIDEVSKEIQRSLFPTLWCCRAVLPGMVERRGGVIVNVSSIATRSINRVPYAAAKGGVNALTASLAMEVAQFGVRVVATAPGGTEAPPRRIPRNTTEQSQQDAEWYEQIVTQTTESTLLKRYGTLEEQVRPILFLASDEASYITGSVLPVGGGDQG